MFLKKLILILVLSALFISQAFASLDAFNKRFTFVKDQAGNVTYVKDNTLVMDIAFSIYLDYLKEMIQSELVKMSEKGFYDRTIMNTLNENGMINDEKSLKSKMDYILESLHELAKVNFNQIMSHPKFLSVISEYESKFKEYYRQVDPSIVASLDNPKHFYKRQIGFSVVLLGLQAAQTLSSSIPMLNTATYVINEINNKMTVRLAYHQNILLHYLEQNSAADLGITESEKNRILSSIYESRIPWYIFWESNRAERSWERYGIDNFYGSVRQANASLRHNRHLYEQDIKRINFSFAKVIQDGEPLIINLLDQKAIFNSIPSESYYYNSPYKVVRFRTILKLSELGLSFLTIPAIVKSSVLSYIQSYYQNQQITEGALFAYFEQLEDSDELIHLKNQRMNPFDIF